jgi:hypothetical protein
MKKLKLIPSRKYAEEELDQFNTTMFLNKKWATEYK